MSRNYDKERDDAYSGKYDPPHKGDRDFFGWLADSSDRDLADVDEYNAGWMDSKYGKKSKKERQGCFVTSACVASAGLPDNCRELQRLREFRDRHLLRSPRGERLVQTYYAVAPVMVARIDSRSDRRDIYRGVLSEIRAALYFIERGESERALRIYGGMFERLLRLCDMA